MTLKECYQILKVDQSASLEDVKRAYRRRAFELHPDLNPHVRDASRQFQLLNEAYVILNRLVAARETAEQRRQEQPQDQSFASRWNSWSFSFGGKKTDAKADTKATSSAGSSAGSNAENAEDRRAEREGAYREEMRREEARRREEKIRTIREEEAKRERLAKQAKERQEHLEKERLEKELLEKERIEKERIEKERLEKERARDIPPRPGAEQAAKADAAQSEASRPDATRPSRPDATRPSRPDAERPSRPDAERPDATRPARPASDDNMHAEQQEVLRDILNDSFARRVFEDIYSEIRKKGPQPERTEAPRPETAKEPPRERTVLHPEAVSAPPSPPKSGFSLGLEQFGLDFSKGMGNTVKSWLRSQIDEEQTIRLPASGLFPGARVRLQIRRGLSDELTTLEVVLPADFVVGKPIRLRGIGKKLGSVQGDLYLTVLSR